MFRAAAYGLNAIERVTRFCTASLVCNAIFFSERKCRKKPETVESLRDDVYTNSNKFIPFHWSPVP